MNQRQKKPQPKREEPGRIQLDFSEHDVEVDIDRQTQLWIGLRKIGKTVNANKAGSYFIKTEAGHSHIKHKGMRVKDWPHMHGICMEIVRMQRAGKFPHDKVCIDTLGEAYKMCQQYICKRYQIMHEGDLGHGKGYALVENAFREAVVPLMNCGLGIIFLAHTEDKELKDDNGEAYKRAVPMLPKGCDRVIGGMVDLLLFFTVRWNDDTKQLERIVKTTPSKYHEAGIRYPENWTRRMPAEIPMSWDALVNAWNAGRPDGYEPPKPKQSETEPEPEQTQQVPAQAPQNAPAQIDPTTQVNAAQGPNQPHPGNGSQRRTGTKLSR